jgi:hypothetical protein
MAVRFYLDADLIGVAKLLVQVRSDIAYPGDPGGIGPDKRNRPRSAIVPGAHDTAWIPVVARESWVVISRDRHIHRRPAERQAVVEHRARLVTLDASRQQLNKLELEIIVYQWRNIEKAG